MISVAIPHTRKVREQPHLKIIRRRVMPEIQRDFSVITRPETVVDMLDSTLKLESAVALVTDAVRNQTRPHDVLRALEKRRRHRHRHLIRSLLFDSSLGIESPLEYLFDRNVETAHGLPRSHKQVVQKIGGRWIRSDCRYSQFLLRIELDGELAHPGGRTTADTWRDNEVALQDSDLTLRYRWHHIIATPCQTARQITTALQLHGWQGSPIRCGPECRV